MGKKKKQIPTQRAVDNCAGRMAEASEAAVNFVGYELTDMQDWAIKCIDEILEHVEEGMSGNLNTEHHAAVEGLSHVKYCLTFPAPSANFTAAAWGNCKHELYFARFGCGDL